MHDTPSGEPRTVYLIDYKAPPFRVLTTALHFELDTVTTVRAELHIQRAGQHKDPLRLDGEALQLTALCLDGADLAATAYSLDEHGLSITNVPDDFLLTVETRIKPEENSELSGLYKTAQNFCTQCEAEGFRRITYYLDRPDVLSRFTTTIDADREHFPVLLSNGNLIEEIDLGGGRHRAVWEDPFPKPSYLFALVAGPLKSINAKFETCSGRNVSLHIYTEAHNISKCEHAMTSLKNAMAWDERQYGREYDLDRYMIVAVDDFNMGAMENKGLNVFNTQYVLANPETASDTDYQSIEGVIGHEYFHNWSGNRVTCRDWFQLSLKEGFTVFRDQQFSADMGSPGVKRIHDVNILRTHQFREDAGPMAHPVRPQSYQEINNFYTTTVYNKGAEVVRMLYHLLGAEGFRKGTDLYFEKFDGQAVTTDDFVDALEQANNVELHQFRRWYDQAGTPLVELRCEYDASAQTYTLHATQSCAPTPGQANKLPFQIPIAIALLDSKGTHIPLTSGTHEPEQKVLNLRQAKQSFTFDNIPEHPVPSVFRGFSAPVKFELDLSRKERFFLMVHDTDPFARWEAAQHMAIEVLVAMIEQLQHQGAATVPEDYINAYADLLNSELDDAAFHAEILTLPSETYIAEFMPVIDPDAIHRARQQLRVTLAGALHEVYLQLYKDCNDTGPYRNDPVSIAKRSLKNTCLAYLAQRHGSASTTLISDQFETATNMTDTIAALSLLCDVGGPIRDHALQTFYKKWSQDALVVNKWLRVQAASTQPDTLECIQALITHPAFNVRNPNKVRALFGTFAHGNPLCFHERSGKAYSWLAEQVLQLDNLNPQIAARLVSAFNHWRRYDDRRQSQIRAVLEKILSAAELSPDVREITSKSLGPR